MRVYTDGSCLKNPGRGGWGYVIVGPDTCASGAEYHTTNNRMEMTAAIQAIEAANALAAGSTLAHAAHTETLEIYTDSKYLINGITKWVKKWAADGWKKANGDAVKNADLWRRLVRLNRPDITWHHVSGHSGDKYNDIADRLAHRAALKVQAPAPHGAPPN